MSAATVRHVSAISALTTVATCGPSVRRLDPFAWSMAD